MNHFERIKSKFSDPWIWDKSKQIEQKLNNNLPWWKDLGEEKQDALTECIWGIMLL